MIRIGIVYHSATGTTAQLAQAVESGVTQVAGAVPHTFSITGDDIRAGRYVNVAGGYETAVPNRLGAQGGLVAQSRNAKVHDADLATATYLGRRVAGLSAHWRNAALAA